MIRRSCLALWLAVCLVGGAPAAAVTAPMVTVVELRSDAPVERTADLFDLVVVEPGSSLDAAAVSRTYS